MSKTKGRAIKRRWLNRTERRRLLRLWRAGCRGTYRLPDGSIVVADLLLSANAPPEAFALEYYEERADG
jgi:hypothetical protein